LKEKYFSENTTDLTELANTAKPFSVSRNSTDSKKWCARI